MQREKIITRFALLAGMLLIILNALYINSKKEDYFFDEKCTFGSANDYVISLSEAIDEFDQNGHSIEKLVSTTMSKQGMKNGKKYGLEELYRRLDAQRGVKFSYLSTLILATGDSHPPLYYMIFTTVDSIFPGITLNIAGFLINILALLGACFFVYKIIELFVGRFGAVTGVLFFGFSFGFINSVTYYRMYALLALELIALNYLYLKWYQSGTASDSKYLIQICGVECLAMLTQFFAAIFILPLFVIMIVLLRQKKELLRKYFASQIITAIAYLLLWPFSIFQIIFNESGEDVRRTASILNLPQHIFRYLWVFWDAFFSRSLIFILISALIIIAFLLIWFGRKIKNHTITDYLHSVFFVRYVILFVPMLVYLIVVADISPWVADRYMMPVYPVIAVCIVILLWHSLKLVIKKETICGAVLLFTIAFSYIQSLRLVPYYLYQTTVEKEQFIAANENKEAIVIEPDYGAEFLDCFMSVDHPYWTRILDKELEEYLADNLDSISSCVFYISDKCDVDTIVDSIQQNGISLIRSDYEKDFFDVYVYD